MLVLYMNVLPSRLAHFFTCCSSVCNCGAEIIVGFVLHDDENKCGTLHVSAPGTSLHPGGCMSDGVPAQE